MSDSPDFKSARMSKKQMRRNYLVTYSRADLELFPTRASFGNAIAEAFNKRTDKFKIQYFRAALENHKDGGKHYHVTIKLDGPKLRLPVKNILTASYDIVVNFSESDDNYSAYKYITKSDTAVFHSEGHPDLSEVGSPRTKK